MVLNAIVIQGETKTDENRTKAIVTHCLSANPNSLVILSTWNLEPGFPVDHPRFKIVQAELPLSTGKANRHMQRWSTHFGIREAIRAGATHILKMRSDHLLRRHNICEFFFTLLQEYGEDRLVVPSTGTTLEECWGKFHVSDWWMYGKTCHLQKWYEIEGINSSGPCFRRDVFVQSPEPDFFQVWWGKQKHDDLSLFEEILGRYFVVVNASTVDYIHKTHSLEDTSDGPIKFWQAYGDPKTVHYCEWLEMFRRYSSRNIDIPLAST